MIAVISGATGLVGSHLIHKLLDDSRFTKVISLSRRSLNITSSKLQEVLCPDFKEMKNKSSELKGDVYFCCLGTTIKSAGSQEKFRAIDFDAVLEFGRIAKSHEAISFVVISADSANSQSRIFYSRVKGEIEKSLKDLRLKHLVIMRPGLLMGERKEFRLGEKTLISILGSIGPYLPIRIRKKTMTPVDALAERMLAESFKDKDSISIIGASQI